MTQIPGTQVSAAQVPATQVPGTHIPGIGPVDWPDAKVDAHAQLVGKTHRPDRPRVELRWHWVLPVPSKQLCCCVSCAQDWPCPELRWAEDWLSATRRALWH